MTARHETPARGDQTPDAVFLELERRLNESRQEAAAIFSAEPANEPAVAAVDKRGDEIERQIADTAAQSVVGVAVKLRLAAHWIKADGSGEIKDSCALSALSDVEALLKEQEASDAEIISMGAKADALEAEHAALLIAFDKAGKVGYCEEADPPFKQASELIGRILDTPAHTPAGIAVKLRIADRTDGWEKDLKEDPKLLVSHAGMSAIADLERLSGPFAPPAGDDAELFELHGEWKRLEGAAEKKDLDTGTENKSDWQAAFDAEKRFLETPARTFAGVLLKLRLGCEPETYALDYHAEDGTLIAPPTVLAALADLERMAGGAA